MSQKFLRILRNSLIFTFFFTIWFIGSTILIQIDSVHINYAKFGQNLSNLTSKVDQECRTKLKRDLEQSIGLVENPFEILGRAKMEKSIRNSLIYFPDLNQMWCLTPKAASSSWSSAILKELNKNHLTLFYLQTGKSDPRKTSLQTLYKENFGRINKNSYERATKSTNIKKILLIRHPFDRIVSSYEEKLSNRHKKEDSLFFYQKYGVDINRKYRKNPQENKQKEPTFEEFIEYLINTDVLDMNEHWQPISVQCGLCHIHYDQIIKFEELENNSEFHLKQLEFTQTIKLLNENKSSSKYKDAKSYYKNIPRTKMVKLYLKYKDDFKLFGYQVESYIHFLSSNSNHEQEQNLNNSL